jgi:hypothetical protein
VEISTKSHEKPPGRREGEVPDASGIRAVDGNLEERAQLLPKGRGGRTGRVPDRVQGGPAG